MTMSEFLIASRKEPYTSILTSFIKSTVFCERPSVDVIKLMFVVSINLKRVYETFPNPIKAMLILITNI